ncbi:hypothetical protein [Actinacidiphila yanglinensis]|uniref:hypothetical protein n=1 Tax=Actinacidiphila yanglinensis TaxID=310779 RepID=UPI00190EDEA9|nr:hypothetical protein [Actinacidiphila yanglinensis]
MEFEGEDGRRCTFGFIDLGEARLARGPGGCGAVGIGPSGGLRTVASALSMWRPVGQLLTSLNEGPDHPEQPGELRLHVRQFARYLCAGRKQLVYVLRLPPLAGQMAPEVHSALRVRTVANPGQVPGYSDGELRRVLAAARSDVRCVALTARQDQVRWTCNDGYSVTRTHR